MNKFLKVVATALLTISLLGCSAHNVDIIKENAAKTFDQAGFKIVGYEGYEYTGLGRMGGCVWYVLEKKANNSVTYHACIAKYGDEYHIYSLSAIDALHNR